MMKYLALVIVFVINKKIDESKIKYNIKLK
ncbi:MAG: hypothetical protein CFH22_00716 [Alphaproteobacteria bacterium MarineAlpha5_Bin12]|nr:MAG: hypothetical protein CFH22_00716 [Alphaproteobacteria bacterium MarineAlpha5_Bin12]